MTEVRCSKGRTYLIEKSIEDVQELLNSFKETDFVVLYTKTGSKALRKKDILDFKSI